MTFDEEMAHLTRLQGRGTEAPMAPGEIDTGVVRRGIMAFWRPGEKIVGSDAIILNLCNEVDALRAVLDAILNGGTS